MVLLFSCPLPAVGQHQTAQTESPGLLMYFVLRRHVWFYGGFWKWFWGFVWFCCCVVGVFFPRAVFKKSKKLLLEVRRKRLRFQTDLARKLNTSHGMLMTKSHWELGVSKAELLSYLSSFAVRSSWPCFNAANFWCSEICF